MTNNQHLAIKIVPDAQQSWRFGWTIRLDGKLREFSRKSYETEAGAASAARGIQARLELEAVSA